MADSKLTALSEMSVPALDDLLYAVDVSDTTDDAAGSSYKITLERLLGLAGTLPGGRLTTETGVSVSTSDRTSQGTIYYTPHVSDYVRLYDGTRIKEYAFTERSLSLSGLTSGKNYDVWLYDNSGTLTLELTAWTSDTARATALAWQTGLGWVKSGTATRLYLGTIRTTATTTTEDSGSTANAGGATPKRFVWNAYNQVRRRFRRVDTTASWTYNSTTWRAARSSNSNRVEVVNGLLLSDIVLRAVASADVISSADSGRIGIGEDSTSSPHADCIGMYLPYVTSSIPIATSLQAAVPLGYHYYQWLEKTHGFGAGMNFYGSDGYNVCGLTGEWLC